MMMMTIVALNQAVLLTIRNIFTCFHSSRFYVNSGLRTKRIILVFYFSKDTYVYTNVFYFSVCVSSSLAWNGKRVVVTLPFYHYRLQIRK